MTTTIEEINVRCPDCGRNIYEAVDNGRCVYCGALVEESCVNCGKVHRVDESGWCDCGFPLNEEEDIIKGVL